MNRNKEKKWENYCSYAPGIRRILGEKGEDRTFVSNGKSVSVNVIAVADGLSESGPFSAVGAKIITEIVVPFLEREFENIWELPPEKLFTFLSGSLWREFEKKLNKFCKENGLPEILTAKGNLNYNIDKYRTTLIACAVCGDRLIFVKFGNGFAVISGENGAYLLSASKNEGFATADVTLLSDSTNSEYEIRRYFLTDNVRSIALFSDGAEGDQRIYDIRGEHSIAPKYFRWIDSATESEENFKAAVADIAATSTSQDDVSVAVMLDKSVQYTAETVEKSMLVHDLYTHVTDGRHSVRQTADKPVQETREETREENRENIEEMIKKEIEKEYREEIREKIENEIREEVREELKKKPPRQRRVNMLKSLVLIFLITMIPVSFMLGKLANGNTGNDNPVQEQQNESENGGGSGNRTTQTKETDKTEVAAFTVVEDISAEIPKILVVGEHLELTGTVRPGNAEKNQIEWSVEKGSADVDGSILITKESGFLTVRATVKDGTANGDYIKDYEIKVISAPKITSQDGTALLFNHGGNFEVKMAENQGEFTFSLSNNAPRGVSIGRESGVIEISRETEIGTHTFEIEAKFASDERPSTKQEFTLRIITAPEITSQDGTALLFNHGGNFEVKTAENQGEFTFSLSNNAPRGVSIGRESGVIEISRETAIGTHTFEIEAEFVGGGIPSTKQEFTLRIVSDLYISTNTSPLNVRPIPQYILPPHMAFLHQFGPNSIVAAALTGSLEEETTKEGSRTFIKVYYGCFGGCDNHDCKTGWVDSEFLKNITDR